MQTFVFIAEGFNLAHQRSLGFVSRDFVSFFTRWISLGGRVAFSEVHPFTRGRQLSGLTEFALRNYLNEGRREETVNVYE